MKQFDIEKLEKAIIYTERMADGRIPYSNQPMDNDILNNPNVIRCMFFIREVLQEVRANNGVIGGRHARTEAAAAFPFEILENFEYQSDKPISHVLRQFAELAGSPDTPIIGASSVNKWLAANDYIVKAVINADGRENWVPTEKGAALGINGIERGESGREYIRIEYNRAAQEFLARNLRTITEESLATRRQQSPPAQTI